MAGEPTSRLRDRATAAQGRGGNRQVTVRGWGEVRDLDLDAKATALRAKLNAMSDQFALALPRGIEAQQFARDAMTCFRTVRDLDKCDPESVLGALMTAAQLGLRPAVLGHCWPLPFWDNQTRSKRAQLVIGYEGYVHLAYESDRLQSVKANVIYEEDYWDWDEASNSPPVHRRPKLNTPRGELAGYYTVGYTTTGGVVAYLMDRQEMLAWRDLYAPRFTTEEERSRGERGKVVGPWSKPVGSPEFDSMGKKTTLRQASKWLPKSARFSLAMRADGTVRTDLTPDAPLAEVTAHPVGQDDGLAGRNEAREQQQHTMGASPPAEPDPTTEPGSGTGRFRG